MTSLARMGALRVRRGMDPGRRRERWTLGVVRDRSGAGLVDFRPHRTGQSPTLLMPPGETVWADPFPWQQRGRTLVFHEELPEDAPRAHIAVMEVAPDLTPVPMGPVLSTGYHLSYPVVFPWRGALFMLPETEQNGTVELHRCIRWPDGWTLEAVLLDGVSAVDTTIVEVDDRWWLFTTRTYGPRGDWDTDLHIFHGSSPLGPWEPHRCNPVKADVANARSAGRLFREGSRLYRPAQDCSERYGYAITINEIRRLDLDGFSERPVRRILPDWRPDVVGIHTINRAGDTVFFDCRIRRRRGQ